MAEKAIWLSHEFSIHSYEEQWNNASGIYIFAGVDSQGRWEPLYIGQADSFQDRIPSHEQWEPAVELGATHVHAMVVPLEYSRGLVERELIQAYQPPLNVQLR